MSWLGGPRTEGCRVHVPTPQRPARTRPNAAAAPPRRTVDRCSGRRAAAGVRGGERARPARAERSFGASPACGGAEERLDHPGPETRRRQTDPQPSSAFLPADNRVPAPVDGEPGAGRDDGTVGTHAESHAYANQPAERAPVAVAELFRPVATSHADRTGLSARPPFQHTIGTRVTAQRPIHLLNAPVATFVC
jgi:hypothetical protein